MKRQYDSILEGIQYCEGSNIERTTTVEVNIGPSNPQIDPPNIERTTILDGIHYWKGATLKGADQRPQDGGKGGSNGAENVAS